MSAEWQKIGGIEVCEGTDGVVGVLDRCSGFIRCYDSTGIETMSIRDRGDGMTTEFERVHCQPRHRLIECADGAVMVLSTDEQDGKTRRGAIVRAIGTSWWMDRGGGSTGPFGALDAAIAVAVAYVTAR